VSEEWLKATSRTMKAARVDPSMPNVARVWNYLVGGRDNFEADRQAARQLIAAAPVMEHVAPASRAFLRRAVTYLAAEAGIRQFLDIGTGMPTAGNTHEVAQAVDPSCRIVYVDNDPVVLSHARAGLRSSPEGATSYLDADARDTKTIVAGACETLDFARPVGVIMIDILNFLEDAGDVLSRLAEEVPAGSYLAVMQPSRDKRLSVAARRWNQLAPIPVILRDRDQVTRWFAGLELVDPGIVEVHQWRPAPGDPDYPGGMPLLGAVARKP
jgi:trans-aconitate methyltransferase